MSKVIYSYEKKYKYFVENLMAFDVIANRYLRLIVTPVPVIFLLCSDIPH